ncbi:hypothetical protein Tco_0339329 [Tanacetum coccineum]
MSSVVRSLKKETSTLEEIVSLNYIKSNKNVIGLRNPDTKEKFRQPVMTREEDDGISVTLDPQTLSSGFCALTEWEVVFLGGTTLSEVILVKGYELPTIVKALPIRSLNLVVPVSYYLEHLPVVFLANIKSFRIGSRCRSSVLVIVAVGWVVPRDGPVAGKTRSYGVLVLPEACLETCLEAWSLCFFACGVRWVKFPCFVILDFGSVLSVWSHGWRQSVDTKVGRSLIRSELGVIRIC